MVPFSGCENLKFVIGGVVRREVVIPRALMSIIYKSYSTKTNLFNTWLYNHLLSCQTIGWSSAPK